MHYLIANTTNSDVTVDYLGVLRPMSEYDVSAEQAEQFATAAGVTLANAFLPEGIDLMVVQETTKE